MYTAKEGVHRQLHMGGAVRRTGHDVQAGIDAGFEQHPVQVSEVSAKAIRDLYALRTALHAYLSQAIVQAAPEAALHALRARAVALIDAFDTHTTEAHLVDVEAYLAEEVRLGDNEVVAGVLDSLQWRIAWFRRLGSLSREQLKVLAADRLRVADAYLDRDARLAEALNRSMLKKAGDYCEQSFLRGP